MLGRVVDCGLAVGVAPHAPPGPLREVGSVGALVAIMVAHPQPAAEAQRRRWRPSTGGHSRASGAFRCSPAGLHEHPDAGGSHTISHGQERGQPRAPVASSVSDCVALVVALTGNCSKQSALVSRCRPPAGSPDVFSFGCNLASRTTERRHPGSTRPSTPRGSRNRRP
jgi:hypothetical protein